MRTSDLLAVRHQQFPPRLDAAHQLLYWRRNNNIWDLTAGFKKGVSGPSGLGGLGRGHLTGEVSVCRNLNNSTTVLFALTISVLTEAFVDVPSGPNSY